MLQLNRSLCGLYSESTNMDSLGTHRLMDQIFEHLKTEQNLLKHLFQLGGQLVLSSFIFATVCIGGGGNVSPTILSCSWTCFHKTISSVSKISEAVI